MKKILKLIVCAAVAIIVVALPGCMGASADDLYQLPELSEGYLKLQSAINGVLGSGAEYASPASGSNRQPIQQEDIDGDGVREVIAFFNFKGSDKPLKMCIFSAADGVYQEVARIEGEGTGIDKVNYLDMDGDGVREIAVGWQIASGTNMLGVYSLKGYHVNQLVNTNYTEYTVCNLDKNTGSEILALRLSQSAPTGEAEMYSMAADGEVVNSTARLSQGLEALLRVRNATLLDGRDAVAVESSLSGGGIAYELLVASSDRLINITMDEDSGVSCQTSHGYDVYCRDMDGDGILDVPNPVPLPVTSESVTFYMIEWYSYYSNGMRRLTATTYNNYTDSWYIVLPKEWIGNIAVRREEGDAGERMIVFSTVNEDGSLDRDFLIIYTLTGANRVDRASIDGRFMLLEDEVVYAAKILVSESSFNLPVSQELIRENFGAIYSEWATGET